MVSRRVLAVALLLAIVAVSAVQASLQHRVTGKLPHPEETATPETLANWARIHRELAARNYTRPTKAQLKEIGYVSNSHQLGDGAYGTDVSSWVGESTWACMKTKGYDFAIVRDWCETCAVDANGVHSVANAWAAGVAHVDVYLFPSYTCGMSAEAQVDALIANMGSIPFGQIWFDIEAGGHQNGAGANLQWLNAALAHTTARLGAGRAGVYTSVYEWGQVMGNQGGPTSYPLWYAHYDGNPSFGDFSGIAGWTRPAMKQFAGDANVCGADVDLNWW